MGFVGALVGQYLTQRGQSESLLQAQKLEAQGAREAALRKLFRASGKLLIDQPLRRASPGDNLGTVVRAQTLTVLERLDPDRKRILLQFQYESGLSCKDKPVVSLVAADLSRPDLSERDKFNSLEAIAAR